MTDFEFMFALFGLMLGLSIAELLAGLARAIEERMQIRGDLRIGWLTPLLAAFVLLDLLSFWAAAWTTRDLVRVSGGSLFLVTAFAGAYYMAARLVFPRALERLSDLDEHFLRIRRLVIGILLVLLATQMAWYLSLPAIAPLLQRPLSLTLTILLAGLMLAAMFLRPGRGLTAVMVLLVARYVLAYLLI
jgi:hypothetical protein